MWRVTRRSRHGRGNGRGKDRQQLLLLLLLLLWRWRRLLLLRRRRQLARILWLHPDRLLLLLHFARTLLFELVVLVPIVIMVVVASLGR